MPARAAIFAQSTMAWPPVAAQTPLHRAPSQLPRYPHARRLRSGAGEQRSSRPFAARRSRIRPSLCTTEAGIRGGTTDAGLELAGAVWVLHGKRRVLRKVPVELGIVRAEGGRQEPRVEACGVFLLEPVELAGEVGDEAGVGEVALPEVGDDVGKRSEAAVVGEQAERSLELREHGKVPREVPGELAAREVRGLEPVHSGEDLEHGGGGAERAVDVAAGRCEHLGRRADRARRGLHRGEAHRIPSTCTPATAPPRRAAPSTPPAAAPPLPRRAGGWSALVRRGGAPPGCARDGGRAVRAGLEPGGDVGAETEQRKWHRFESNVCVQCFHGFRSKSNENDIEGIVVKFRW